MAMIGDGRLIERKSGEETGSGIHPYILIWAVFVVSDETSPDISFNVKRVFVDYATLSFLLRFHPVFSLLWL